MKRERDHGLHAGEIDDDRAVVIGGLGDRELFIVALPAVDAEVFLRLFVRLPDGRKAGRLRRHHVDADAVIHGEVRNAGSDELQNLIFDESACKRRLDERERHVLRTDALPQFPLEIDRDHGRAFYVVRLAKELFDELGSALAHRHRAERAVAGVRIGAEDHGAALRGAFAHVLMDDGDVRGHIVAAVLLCGGEPEHVVVLVDGAAHRAQGIMAIGERVGNGEFFKPARLRRLDNAHVCDIVRGDRIETDAEVLLVARVVRLQNGIGEGVFDRRLLLIRSKERLRLFDDAPFRVIDALFDEFDHAAVSSVSRIAARPRGHCRAHLPDPYFVMFLLYLISCDFSSVGEK